jgi:hypothetical protein
VSGDALRAELRKLIEDAVPADEECLASEDACFDAHPVHGAGWVDGRLDLVYADVDGLVELLAGWAEAR